MELICPSCEARYQVPDGSVGEKGRQVSCMSCGHSWHAFPPLFLGSASAPPVTASPGIDWQSPPAPGRSTASFAHTDPESRPAPPRPPERPSEPSRATESATPAEPQRATEPSRSEQLAEIREMLAEVQSEERAAAALAPERDAQTRIAPAPAPAPASEPAGPAAEPPAASGAGETLPVSTASHAGKASPPEEQDEEEDPLRRRMAIHDRKRTDVEKLRRRHDRRSRRNERARKAGSGAFLTGFLLVVMIAAVMTAIYVLQPQIVARMPETGPMLDEYVRTVDNLRVSIAEAFEAARAWVMELIEKSA